MEIDPNKCNGNCFCNCHRKTTKDYGPWYSGKTSDGRVFVQSEDFTHDVRLYIDGDFAGIEDKLLYAEDIKKRLNTNPNELEDTLTDAVMDVYHKTPNYEALRYTDVRESIREILEKEM